MRFHIAHSHTHHQKPGRRPVWWTTVCNWQYHIKENWYAFQLGWPPWAPGLIFISCNFSSTKVVYGHIKLHYIKYYDYYYANSAVDIRADQLIQALKWRHCITSAVDQSSATLTTLTSRSPAVSMTTKLMCRLTPSNATLRLALFICKYLRDQTWVVEIMYSYYVPARGEGDIKRCFFLSVRVRPMFVACT